jgi:hypothetical protein
MKTIRLKFLVLMFAVSSIVGCGTPKPPPNPLANWHRADLAILHSNAAITQDYQDYIQNLPPKERGFVGSVEFFTDGTGQHAVEIGVGVDGRWWRHILIYNHANERTRVMVDKTGWYSS